MNTMLKICGQHNVVELSTYSREHGRKGRFLIDKKRLDAWVDEAGKGTFYDADLASFLRATWRENGNLSVHMSWLRECFDGTLSGTRQHFELPIEDFMDAAECEHPVRLLATDTRKPGTVTLAPSAHRAIGTMPRSIRRALSKAMRSHFDWPETETTIYADGKFDFFFRTDDGLCGGLILHTNSRGGYSYGLHT